MKASFFHKPLSVELNLEGESWHQGAEICGSLIISNMGNDTIDISSLKAHLCFASLKKVKAQDSKAFKIYQSTDLKKNELGPKEVVETIIKFNLALNFPITETTASPYIVCGEIERPYEIGTIQLKIIPLKMVSNIIEIVESFLKFKFKALKNKNDFIQVAMTPPDTKEWTTIQKMILNIKPNEDSLEFEFNFSLKKLSFDAGSAKTKDEKKTINKTVPLKELTFYGDAPNQDNILKVFNEVLDQVKLKKMF